MEIVLKIEDSKVDFFLDLIKNFKFVKIIKSKNEIKAIDNKDEVKLFESISRSMEEIKRHKKGEIKLKSAKEFLNEL